jgi:uncharacterized membrane protein
MSYFSKNILTKEELQKIADTIQGVEKETIGEVRVNIQKTRTFQERRLTVYDLAIKNFYQLGMDNTKDKTGVLIYLLLSDKKFQIIGDEGINQKVSDDFWNVLAMQTAEYFKSNKFSDGICYAVNVVGKVLKKEFPMKPGDTNELPNEVVIS